MYWVYLHNKILIKFKWKEAACNFLKSMNHSVVEYT